MTQEPHIFVHTPEGLKMVKQQPMNPKRQGRYQQQPPPQQPASRHRAGHHVELHPEDSPYLTNTGAAQTARASRTNAPTNYDTVLVDEEALDEEEGDEGDYFTRPPRSAIRHRPIEDEGVVTRQGVRVAHHYHDQPIIQRRTRQQAPPTRQQYDEYEEERPARRRVRVHPNFLVFVSIGLLLLIAGWIAYAPITTAWQMHQDDITYGNPRTFQIDAVVGHGDSNSNPSHFIALNLRGRITVTEAPGGDMTKAISYHFPTVVGNTGNPPVTIAFQDFDNDGRLDMIVRIGDPGSQVTYMMQNDGKQFISKV